MPHSDNRIMSRASRVDLEDLRPHLRVVELKQGMVLAESRARVDRVYFPHAGILSFVVELENGWGIESGMIGKDGVFGAAQALDSKVSLHHFLGLRMPCSFSASLAYFFACFISSAMATTYLRPACSTTTW